MSRPSSALSAHERLFGSSSRDNSSVSPPESPAGKKGTSISSGNSLSSPIMSPIFKSDTARAIAKEVGLNDVSSMPKSSGKNKKRSLTISGSNPAVREALNNHQAKFADRAIDDLDMDQALRNNADGGLCTPDVIKSALDPKSEGSKISETTIDRLFGVPDKIVIPERYIPDTVSIS